MRVSDAEVLRLLRELAQIEPSQGDPLDSTLLTTMESRFQTNLRDVRIHASPWSYRACELLGADAFSWRNHIAFGDRVLTAHCGDFQRVLVHELAHIVQRTRGRTF